MPREDRGVFYAVLAVLLAGIALILFLHPEVDLPHVSFPFSGVIVEGNSNTVTNYQGGEMTPKAREFLYSLIDSQYQEHLRLKREK